MPSYLVTGASGQLGQCFQAVAKEFFEVDLYFAKKNEVDITRLDTISNGFKHKPFDGIINCAAYAAVDQAEKEEGNAFKINVDGIQNLIDFAEHKNLSIIHFSTDYVFDGLSKLPLSENSNTNPINEYGSSKLKGEQVCLKNDTNSIIIRTSWLYSSFGNNFLKTMIELMKKNNSVKVVNDQIGSPTYAYDLAKVILKIIVNYKTESGLFHYSNEGEISWFEFARSIRELYNLDCEIIGVSSDEFKTLAKRPKYSLLDKSKIKNTFNLELPNYKPSLKNCIEIIKNET